PGGYSHIAESHLIDGLWNNRSERWGIRLGKLLRAYEMRDQEDPEEFLVNPHSLAFNSKVEQALFPHRRLLAQLIDHPNNVDDTTIPAIVWLSSLKNKPLVIHWTGGLTLNDLARINNYFFRHVLKICKDSPLDWITGLVMSHAQTLVVAYRHQELFLQDKEFNYTGRTTDGKVKHDAVDVDMEALILLEKRMFDTSEDAGIAGNYQWGLDISMHQDGWFPWSSRGPEGDKDIREGNESELEVS
ncbi:hypothetical protein EDD18DRAFT_1029208, partial [Armillaria luteobubalina]